MPSWNYFYHVTSNTKSTWLRGDPRGFRTRHHREHVEGDYRNPPPPGVHEETFALSKSLLKTPPVFLTWEQRMIVCRVMAEALEFHDIECVDIAITAKHFHLLAQFPPDRFTSSGRPILDAPRHFVGIAKKESARRLSAAGLKPQGPTWAVRSHPEPIENEDHFQFVKDVYIPGHIEQGAVVHSIHVVRR